MQHCVVLYRGCYHTHPGLKINNERITYLREEMVRRVMREIPDVMYNGHPIERLPGNASFSFRDVNAAALLVLLEEAGICASAASACTAGSTQTSHVIKSIGVPDDYSQGTIRLTLGRENTPADVAYCVQKLKESVQLLKME
ncbi:MAG: aminotransferase class V-fold PLP-dependent enzyme, partial [Clostridiales bacterium]|nr:aminotransferase class V-fold PLP-dependent enzyme [Clostridiales bacterium]